MKILLYLMIKIREFLSMHSRDHAMITGHFFDMLTYLNSITFANMYALSAGLPKPPYIV